MDKVAIYKEQIYDLAIEKEAGVLSALKGVGTAVAESGLGKQVGSTLKNVGEMGLGKKMLTGAGVGGTLGMMKQPAQGQDRLSNAVSGAFGGAALGATVHGVTSGLNAAKGAEQVAKGSSAIVTPAPAPKLQLEAPKVSESIPHYNTVPVMQGTAPTVPTAPTNAIDAQWKAAQFLIEDLYQEKLANAAGEILEDGVKAVENTAKNVDPNSFTNKAKRLYNHTLGANTLKTTAIGAGVGGAAGALGYKEDQDDGSFEHSRFGAMATGMGAGAGAGLATGLMFKKMPGVPKVPGGEAVKDMAKGAEKVSEYREVILEMAKEASLVGSVSKGATDALAEFKKLEPIMQVAIGSSIGGTVGLLTGLQREKDKDIPTKDKIKTIGGNVFRSAMIGGSVAGFMGYQPGQLTKDVNEAKDAIKVLKKEGVL